MKNTIIFFSSLISALFLCACSPNVSPNTYTGNEVGVASHVIPATVVSMRQIKIDNSSSAGGVTGAVMGGAAGTAIGGSVPAKVAGAAAGVLAGAVIGHELDKAVNAHIGYEYILRTGHKKMISVTQTEDLKLSINQHVLVIYGDMVRIVPDDTKKLD